MDIWRIHRWKQSIILHYIRHPSRPLVGANFPMYFISIGAISFHIVVYWIYYSLHISELFLPTYFLCFFSEPTPTTFHKHWSYFIPHFYLFIGVITLYIFIFWSFFHAPSLYFGVDSHCKYRQYRAVQGIHYTHYQFECQSENLNMLFTKHPHWIEFLKAAIVFWLKSNNMLLISFEISSNSFPLLYI